MKKVIMGFLSLFVFVCAGAQSFNKGDKVVNLGLGIGNTLYGSGYKTSIPPVSASFEYGIVDNLFDEKSSIGIGGYLGYAASKYKYNGLGSSDFEDKFSSTIIGVRGSFHYSFVEKLDTYTGLSLGYNIVSFSSDQKNNDYSYSAASSAMFLGWYAGARYYFTNSFAVMGEIGYDVAYLNVGVAFKF